MNSNNLSSYVENVDSIALSSEDFLSWSFFIVFMAYIFFCILWYSNNTDIFWVMRTKCSTQINNCLRNPYLFHFSPPPCGHQSLYPFRSQDTMWPPKKEEGRYGCPLFLLRWMYLKMLLISSLPGGKITPKQQENIWLVQGHSLAKDKELGLV